MQARCLTEREKERFKCFSIRGDFIKAEIPASREGCGGRLRERETVPQSGGLVPRRTVNRAKAWKGIEKEDATQVRRKGRKWVMSVS